MKVDIIFIPMTLKESEESMMSCLPTSCKSLKGTFKNCGTTLWISLFLWCAYWNILLRASFAGFKALILWINEENFGEDLQFEFWFRIIFQSPKNHLLKRSKLFTDGDRLIILRDFAMTLSKAFHLPFITIHLRKWFSLRLDVIIAFIWLFTRYHNCIMLAVT